MNKVYVVTIPHTGTHFVEKLLSFLKVPHERIHAQPHNHRKLWQQVGANAKIVTTWRAFPETAASLYTRVVDFQKMGSRGPAAAAYEAELNLRTWWRFMSRPDIEPFGIPLDKDDYEKDDVPRMKMLDHLCDYLVIAPTDQARAMVAMWPVESQFNTAGITLPESLMRTVGIPTGIDARGFQWYRECVYHAKQYDLFDTALWSDEMAKQLANKMDQSILAKLVGTNKKTP